ncbi:MAG: hypothetical protein R3182_03295 [Draconibacterium sp.]|nr:hypothetical protein [Draconibacterium sp.]
MKTIFTLIICLLITTSLFAQKTGNAREVPFQITLIPPLGTNGIHSGNTINKFSLNIIGGYAAGLNGVEFGGFANINRDFMHGVQFAGFGNITNGEALGVQFAGFGNINSLASEAVQFAGFANITNGSNNGFQAAGFGNFIRGESKIVQAAGFGNFSHSILGAQMAGFGNFASGKVKGAQIAGFGNFALEVEGAQIAGFINTAKSVDGIQIGVLNVADTVKNGIPIGVLSVVRNGYREFEIGVSEGLNNYASFKIGVKQFYNIFSVGMQYLSDQFRWGVGYGIGTHLIYSEDFKVNIETMSYYINDGRHWSKYYNGLQQLKFTFARSLSENVSLFAGPTFNLMVTDYPGTGDFAPYHFVSHRGNNTYLQGWIGFNAGIRIR